MNVNEIREQLGLPKIVGEFKGNAYSSAFVKLEENCLLYTSGRYPGVAQFW